MDKEQKRLSVLFKSLDSDARRSLLDFAEFLHGRNKSEPGGGELQLPNLLPAEDGETVIQAIKRLTASYPMLDKSKMLNDTSVLMTQHTLQGREADEVISELQQLFETHYQQYVDEIDKDE